MKQSLTTSFVRLFGRLPEAIAQAPGRIEFIGNHTDYNGGVVMGVALDKTVMVALAKRNDRRLVFASAKSGEKIAVDLDNIQKQEREYNWVNYPLGVFKYLLEAGLKADCGFDMLDCSNLPAGAGLSSSAAIELASAFAMSKLYDFKADLKTLVRIGRKCENHFVGMPCGILDQGVSGFGKENGIVFIDCLTEDFSTYPLPSNCKFWLFNSTKKHALVDGLYAERHAECMQGAKVLSEGGQDRPLRAFTTSDLEAVKDKLSDVVYRRAKHVIEENDRVMKAKEYLLSGDICSVGKLLNASHESSRKLFENSCEELDFLVDTVSTMKGVYGARLSGGGFGGAVMALTDESFSQEDADKVSEIYEKRFGKKPMVFTCASGDGAKVI